MVQPRRGTSRAGTGAAGTGATGGDTIAAGGEVEVAAGAFVALCGPVGAAVVEAVVALAGTILPPLGAAVVDAMVALAGTVLPLVGADDDGIVVQHLQKGVQRHRFAATRGASDQNHAVWFRQGFFDSQALGVVKTELLKLQ